jgi:hypothetical protein
VNVSADSSGSLVGALEFVNDFPTADTVGRMREELKFQAAVQVYLWSIPYMAMMSLRDAHRSVGATTIPFLEQFLTAKTVAPTGNQAPRRSGPCVLISSWLKWTLVSRTRK